MSQQWDSDSDDSVAEARVDTAARELLRSMSRDASVYMLSKDTLNRSAARAPPTPFSTFRAPAPPSSTSPSSSSSASLASTYPATAPARPPHQRASPYHTPAAPSYSSDTDSSEELDERASALLTQMSGAGSKAPSATGLSRATSLSLSQAPRHHTAPQRKVTARSSRPAGSASRPHSAWTERVTEHERELERRGTAVVDERLQEIEAYRRTLQQAMDEVRRVQAAEAARLAEREAEARNALELDMQDMKVEFQQQARRLHHQVDDYLFQQRRIADLTVSDHVRRIAELLEKSGGQGLVGGGRGSGPSGRKGTVRAAPDGFGYHSGVDKGAYQRGQGLAHQSHGWEEGEEGDEDDGAEAEQPGTPRLGPRPGAGTAGGRGAHVPPADSLPQTALPRKAQRAGGLRDVSGYGGGAAPTYLTDAWPQHTPLSTSTASQYGQVHTPQKGHYHHADHYSRYDDDFATAEYGATRDTLGSLRFTPLGAVSPSRGASRPGTAASGAVQAPSTPSGGRGPYAAGLASDFVLMEDWPRDTNTSCYDGKQPPAAASTRPPSRTPPRASHGPRTPHKPPRPQHQARHRVDTYTPSSPYGVASSPSKGVGAMVGSGVWTAPATVKSHTLVPGALLLGLRSSAEVEGLHKVSPRALDLLNQALDVM